MVYIETPVGFNPILLYVLFLYVPSSKSERAHFTIVVGITFCKEEIDLLGLAAIASQFEIHPSELNENDPQYISGHSPIDITWRCVEIGCRILRLVPYFSHSLYHGGPGQ